MKFFFLFWINDQHPITIDYLIGYSKMAEETPFTIERNFSFIIEGKLAGSHKPGNHPSTLQTDLQILKEKFKITAIVSLSESPLDENEVKKFGFEYLYLPVRDYYPPSIEQMCQLVKFVNSNQCTLIHCNAGMVSFNLLY